MPFVGLFRGVDIASTAMGAERTRMDISAENLAHAGATRKLANGLPYARQRVRFDEVLDAAGRQTGQVAAEVVASPRYTQRHDPQHPDADPATGLVTQSDIDPVLELTDMIVAARALDANANAMRGQLRMHESALRIAES
jgi:flagellar basal-body rod protein FlgC